MLEEFLRILGKFENQLKTLGELFWTNFVKINFQKVVDEFSVNFRNIFVFAI